ncbi:dipeptidyl peptidase 9-like [Lytechinus pictus]|uniref:dipeptidyl peptidase 9-like n=1 Tax=Lytechinus pictus TaxID=7653 RepID=UPI0030B9C664
MATGPTSSTVPDSNPPFSQGLQGGDRKRTWQELHSNVKSMRRIHMLLANRVSLEFTFRVVETENGPRTRLYFLGVPPGNRENTLLHADMPTEEDDGSGDSVSRWKPLLIPFRGLMQTGNFSKEEQLLRERKRMGTFGITTYDCDVESGRFLFPASGSLFTCVDPDLITYPVYPSEVPTQCQGVRLDAKLCPTNSNLLAFITENDLWVSNAITGDEKRITFANKGLPNIAEDPCSAGVTSYIIQEEFDRYTGYWWQPDVPEEQKTERTVYRILYEEVDESEVEILNIVAPGHGDGGVDRYRYPKAGTTNAKNVLKIVEFTLNDEGKLEESCIHKELREPLKTMFPWMEYIIRLGWTPNGRYVWAQLLSRNQQSTVLLLIPMDSFVPVGQDKPMTSEGQVNKPVVRVLYEEHSDIWINSHNVTHFFPQTNPNEMSFIWASEATGTRHLYQITSDLHPREAIPGSLKPAILKFEMLTSGHGEVSAHNIWVDEDRSLVCYTALHDSPIEEHLYVVSYADHHPPIRITQLGYSVQSAMISPDFQYCVCTVSNLTTPPFTTVNRLEWSTTGSLGVSMKELFKLMLPHTMPFPFVPPELFTYKNSSTGDDMYGLLFKPHNIEPGKQYPTVQFVYGGPQVQLVSNSFKGVRFLRLYTLASLGYAVVIVDGRGSCKRGLRFEGVLRNRLGHVELDDQVEGLRWIAAKSECIDLNRIAIHGWSYGGYLSLMGLAKKPDVYKVAIAGAPVTCWTVYDTGYTERYLDTPSNNPTGYVQSSVLNLAKNFPNDENRLLIVHGLIDENVHFHHTSLLIDELVKHCKPYHLQIYPQERHGIRRLETSEHYETNILSWLQQHV